MSEINNISIIGGDNRQVYLAEVLIQKGYNVYTYAIANHQSMTGCIYCSSLEDALHKGNIIILPFPLSTNNKTLYSLTPCADLTLNCLYSLIEKRHLLFGGKIPDELMQRCANSDVKIYDYLSWEQCAVLNAVSTAEGAIMKAMCLSEYTIHSNKALVLGYGRCGLILSDRLKALNADVTVVERKSDKRAYANAHGINAISFDNMNLCPLSEVKFIFNTVPHCVLKSDTINKLNKDTVIVDIASSPGGVDYACAASLGIKAELFLGIPGKVSPKSGALVLSSRILSIIRNEE